MAGRVRLIQNSFTSGELSPRLAGRTDVEYNFNGAETIENWIVLPQGGLRTRPGTRFIAEVGETDLNKEVRLIPFQFNDEQAYIVEVGRDVVSGHGYFRFYRNTAQITVPQTDAVITNGDFPSNISGWTNRSAGTGAISWQSGAFSTGVLQLVGAGIGNEGRAYQQVSIGAAFRNVEHVLRFRVILGSIGVNIGTSAGGTQILSANEFFVGWHTISFNPGGASSVFIEFDEFNVQTTQIDDVTLLSNAPVTLLHPFRLTAPTLDLFDIQFDQSADIMWLTHRTTKPQKLSRRGHSAWSANNYTPTNDPFLSSVLFPRAVALWKSRLWFAGTDSGPNEFWATVVDNFESLNPGTSTDKDAINGKIAGGKINVIRSIIGLDKQLFIGTYGSEMFLRGDTSGKVAAATVNNNPATEHGVSSLRPVKASGYLLFMQRSNRKLRQLTYDFNTDAFVAPDLLLLAEHLAEEKLRDLAYAEDPDPIIWVASKSGELLGATFLPTHKVLGWHRHPTAGSVESVATIPHPNGDRDQVWLIVKRTINGVEKRFVEVLEDTAGFYGQYTLDCALHYDGAPSNVNLTLSATSGTGVTVAAASAVFAAGDVGKQIWHPDGITKGAITVTAFTDTTHVTGDVVVPFASTSVVATKKPWRRAVKTLTGLGHLEGHAVKVLTDGAVHPDRTVASGAITLEAFSAQAEVGLDFKPRIVGLRPEVQGASSIQGLTMTRSNLKLRVLDTLTLTVNGQELPDRSPLDPMDAVPPLFTGDLEVPVLGWEEDAKITITQDTHQPATLLALMSYIWFGDE